MLIGLTIKSSQDFSLLFRSYLFQIIMLVLLRRSFLLVSCRSISGNNLANYDSANRHNGLIEIGLSCKLSCDISFIIVSLPTVFFGST